MAFEVEYTNTPFCYTSESGWPNRQNWRCEILLTRNKFAIKGKTVLDIASHDGRLTYGLKKLGAKKVVGVEGREQMVSLAKKNFSQLNLDGEFICEDIFQYLPMVSPKSFDTICCFGFYYHTMKQYELFYQIQRIKPQYFILDSNVSSLECKDPIHVLKWEDSGSMGKSIDPLGLICMPTKKAIEFMFKKFHMKAHELHWTKDDISNWSHLENYKRGQRVSYFCEF